MRNPVLRTLWWGELGEELLPSRDRFFLGVLRAILRGLGGCIAILQDDAERSLIKNLGPIPGVTTGAAMILQRDAAK